MNRKNDWREFWIVLSCLILAVISILYNISREGMFGLPKEQWNIVWLVSENGIMLLFSVISGIYFIGLIRYIFRWVFTPLFIIKLIYHFTCFTGVYLFSPAIWEVVWSFMCAIVVLAGLVLIVKKVIT